MTGERLRLILAWCHPEARRRAPVLQSRDPSPSLRVTPRRNLVSRVASGPQPGLNQGEGRLLSSQSVDREELVRRQLLRQNCLKLLRLTAFVGTHDCQLAAGCPE